MKNNHHFLNGLILAIVITFISYLAHLYFFNKEATITKPHFHAIDTTQDSFKHLRHLPDTINWGDDSSWDDTLVR